jgi:hypothetical protein
VTEPDRQLFLFSAKEERGLYNPGPVRKPELDMAREKLQDWKGAIATYQQEVRASQSMEQGTLFALERTTANPEAIDPFYLKLHNFFFFERPASHLPAQPCIYFVIDMAVPLILYIGETCKANQRWKGVHDCKRYVLNYRQLHHRYGLKTAINTAFYWETPQATRPRQRLEAALIYRWRSPFNKENWEFWGTPFIGEKIF